MILSASIVGSRELIMTTTLGAKAGFVAQFRLDQCRRRTRGGKGGVSIVVPAQVMLFGFLCAFRERCLEQGRASDPQPRLFGFAGRAVSS